jgi:hypothetical protein
MVVESIPWLKVAVIFWLVGTLRAASAGFVEMTVGSLVSELAPVTKVNTKLLASGVPPALSAPVVIVTLYGVPGVSKLVGVKIAVLFVAS